MNIEKMIKKIAFSIGVICLVMNSFAQKNKVFVIGIDGCRPDALIAANTPNIDKLMENATYSLDAWNEGTTSSGPSWSSMLTGVWQSKHGVNDNSFNGKNYDEFPHFFKYVEDYNSDLHTASISQWGPIDDHIAAPFADVVVKVSGESKLISETVNYLQNKNPDALFIQFDDVDGAGHGNGYGPDIPNYLKAIEEVDAGIGQMMEALKNRDNYADENWLIIVSTDHGGVGSGHGGDSAEERNIFLICSGDNIPQNEIKKDSTLTVVAPVENCLKDSVELYFDGKSKVNTSLNDVFNFGTDKDFTVECRVRTAIAADVAIVTDKDWVTGRNKGFVVSFSNNTWKVNIGDGTNRKDINGNAIQDNEWHTLSTTVDRDGQLIIYEDGEVVDSTSMAGIGDIYSGFPISFGADANNAYAYKGYIAEVRIFNKVLSEEAINNWNCKVIDSTHTDISSLIGYWRLTEGANSEIVQDLSATAANGIIAGAKWKNALDNAEFWQYDFSNTPRIVDVAVSALEHLCVPINSEWKLDGNAVGTSCLTTGMNQTKKILDDCIKVYPNPVTDYVIFESTNLAEEGYMLTIFNSIGLIVESKEFNSNKLVCDSHQLGSGIFFYKVISNNKNVACGKFVVN